MVIVRIARVGAVAVLAGVLGAVSPVRAQGVPLVVNPPAGYPYPNVAETAPASEMAPGASPAADASDAPGAGGAAGLGSGPAAPQVDPTSKAPNTYGSGGAPPRLNVTGQTRDDSPTMRVGGSFPPKTYLVSLRALGLYRHDPLEVRDGSGRIISYAGVALQFLPGISTIVHPSIGSGASLVALSHATLSVLGRDGRRASFRSDELVDAEGNPRVFLVDQRRGVPLGSAEGPFRLISPHDKNASRWIRDVVEIDVNR